MIDFKQFRKTVATGLRDYLGCPVIRSNQNEEPPEYPYVSYTIRILLSENKGTYGEYEDGIDRIPRTQTWSISALSDDEEESVLLSAKAQEWFQRVGTLYLNDNGVVVQSVGSITPRDNILTIEYEYKKGFDVVFWLLDETENTTEQTGYIETVEIGNKTLEPETTTEELNERLENRLEGGI